MILDSERCLEWWNPSATQLLGLREDDRYQPIINLIRSPEFVEYIKAGDFGVPLECPAPGHEARILQFSASIFAQDEVALVVQDITRLRNLEQTRKDFVANISHELRTPLTVMTGYIETLQASLDEEQSPMWRKALAQMEQQATRMNLLTEDLMMLSRLESTPAQAIETVQLDALIPPIIENAKALSEGKHQFSFRCPGPVTIKGTSKELHSAFANLIYNAVKHNPEGCGIAVSISEDDTSTSVEIKDTGRGIDSRHLPRLTERFYRPDDGRSTQMGGTGLGLAIVKHVLLRHQGELLIDSALGKGSTFTCRFARA